MAERWLISFQYKVWFGPRNGRFTGGEYGVDMVSIIDEHPAKFAADMAQKYNEFREKEDPDARADQLMRIYSATPVPDGTLTKDETELLQ